MTPVIRALEVGVVARAALERSAGVAEPLAAGGPLYLHAAGEVVWLGSPGAVLHPRAVIAAGARPDRPHRVVVDLTAARIWDPPLPAVTRTAVRTFTDTFGDLLARLVSQHPAQGLASLLWTGARPQAGVEAALAARARPGVLALAGACDADDASAAIPPATELLGLGPGLTPAGDDLVGGVLFGRAVLGRGGAVEGRAWAAAGAAIVAAARGRTHPVSAALLADLAAARGHAPLLDLVAALAAGGREAGLDAASRLTALGHSSGWDMLAGLALGTLGRHALR